MISPRNRRRLRSLIACLALALAGLPAGARDLPGVRLGRDAKDGHARSARSTMPPMPPPPVCGMAPAAPFDRLSPRLASLHLTEEQEDRMFALHHARAPQLYEKRKAAARAADALLRLAASDRFDATRARALATAHGQALGDLALLHAEGDAQIRAVLTPEQRKQLDDSRRQELPPHPPLGGSPHVQSVVVPGP